jgi:hypothetical protein
MTKVNEVRDVTQEEWEEALAQQPVLGSNQRALRTHLITSVSVERRGGETVEILPAFLAATLGQEIAAVVAGVVAADIVDNIIDRKFPEPRPSGRSVSVTGADGGSYVIRVVNLPPIPPTRSLSPHEGVPG